MATHHQQEQSRPFLDEMKEARKEEATWDCFAGCSRYPGTPWDCVSGAPLQRLPLWRNATRHTWGPVSSE